MQRIRQRVKELTPRSRCHADIRVIIADLNPVLQGWAQYFRTGNAATRFIQLDSYGWRLLQSLRRKGKGRNLKAGEILSWPREYFESLGLYRLRGTIRYPRLPFWESHNVVA
jgi:RNA-directed DNA polymerase